MKSPPLPQVVSVIPNPFYNDFSIHLKAIVSEQVIVSVYNKDGNTILTSIKQLSEGNNEIIIEMGNQFPGVYFLKCHTQNNSFLVVVRIEKK